MKFCNYLSILLFAVTFSFISCKNDVKTNTPNLSTVTTNPEPTKEDKMKALAKNPEAVHRIFQTAEFKLFVDYIGEKNTTLSLRTEGLNPEFQEYKTIEGNIFNVFILDLDGNTFNEFVFSIKKNDGSDGSELLAYISDKGESLKNMKIEPISEKIDPGMDIINFNRNQIIRNFRSNGKIVEYKYSVVKKDNEYVLSPNKVK